MSQLSYGQIEGYWIAAGGPPSVANIAAAITYPESSANPSAVQQGQPYSTTGWGLWQITPGNSVPSAGVDKALLDPMANAKAAVAKYKGAGNSFRPWTTYTSGKYARYVQNGVAPIMPNGAVTPASGGVATLTANTTPDPGSPDSKCLWGWNGVGGIGGSVLSGVLGSNGQFCLITKTQARAILGGVFVAAGALVALIGVVTIVKGIESAPQALNTIAVSVPAAPGQAASTAESETKTEGETISGTLPESPDRVNDFPTKRGTLKPPARNAGKSKKVTARGALKAAVAA